MDKIAVLQSIYLAAKELKNQPADRERFCKIAAQYGSSAEVTADQVRAVLSLPLHDLLPITFLPVTP